MGGGAFSGCSGKVWNETEQAWEDVWASTVYLYNNGDQCTRLTGGWTAYGVGSAMTTSLSPNLSITRINDTSGQQEQHKAQLSTVDPVDLAKYDKLYIHIASYSTVSGGSSSPGVYLYINGSEAASIRTTRNQTGTNEDYIYSITYLTSARISIWCYYSDISISEIHVE